MAEDSICGGCDCVPNEDGCECREVCCVNCGFRNHIYNMENLLKESGEDWNAIPFHDKIDHFYCASCFGADDLEEALTHSDEECEEEDLHEEE
jgi:hypothetical protein